MRDTIVSVRRRTIFSEDIPKSESARKATIYPFPSYKKIAEAFGYPYFEAHSNAQMKEAVRNALSTESFAFCEIFTDTKQVWEPKSSTKRLPDGRLVSPPLEDLAPFLEREELLKNLYITPIEEE